MPGGDPVRVQPAGCGVQELVARAAGCGLDRHVPGSRKRTHVAPADVAWDPDAARECAAERLVAVALAAPQAVIQVRDTREREPAGPGQIAQEQQQSDGVGPARNGRQHPGTWRNQAVALNGAPDAILE